jgi:hypothetical protein
VIRLARALVAPAALLFIAAPSAAPGAVATSSDGGAAAVRDSGSQISPARATALRRPRGTYTGRRGTLTLLVSRRSIDLAAFDYPCDGATGRTSLNDIPIARRRGRYRFSIRAHGITTYSDGHADENAVIRLSGRFTPKAGRAIGTFRVKTPHCGPTGRVRFTARR